MQNNINVVQLMNLPERLVINTRIHKKTLLDNADLTSAEKKLVRDDVQDMMWIAAIKHHNANIPPFENNIEIYDEVHIISVRLKKEKSYKKVAELLQKSIPYPLFLSLQYEGSFCFNTATKQINQNDKTKRTISDYQFTEWVKEPYDPVTQKFFEAIHFDKLSSKSLKGFYNDLNKQLVNYQLAIQSGTFNSNDKNDKNKILKRLNEIDNELVILRNMLKKETSFQKKVELNIQIVNLNDEKNSIIQSLKE